MISKKSEAKNKIRQAILQKRNTLSEREIQTKSIVIQQRVISLPNFRSAKVIGAYYPKGSEVNTLNILSKVLEGQKILALPATLGDKIFFYKISNMKDLGDQLILNKYGIKEPSPSSTELIDDIDVIIVPGIAFDRNGYRLGYGRGYYDRYLQNKKCVFSLGLAFEIQLIDNDLPREHFDQKVNAVVTEEKIMLC
ncbi:MAG TPA: 5-formyltetrahydrofolate cyclo-ligase [Nitrososphaeraceae archaeon]|nr:5-formyltetrahydrofolate cyclo-ligase [Nitrososphaeraceae archaeon]